MNSLILCCILVLYATRVFSVTISAPPMQRKNLGESCTFRWNVTGMFTTYTIKILSTGSSAALGPNTNHTYNGIKGVVTLFIWNIQTSNAGYYSLSIKTGPSTEENSIAVVLFVYAAPYTYTILAVGRNPGFEGDKLELNCSVTSNSLPVAYQNALYYYWNNVRYGSLRNISTGPVLLQNGDVLPGYSIKNDGKTLVIASAQYADSSFYCSVQEEGSPYKSTNIAPNLQIYSRPYIYSFIPTNRKLNTALSSYIFLSFYYQANPPLISYTNWSFVNTSGSTEEYPIVSNPFTSVQIYLSLRLSSANSYGNYSVTLTNSNGSKTVTFQVLPPGPPDTPSNFSVQYVTHSLVSLQWRCMWFNGVQQTIFVRLMDVTNNEEVETQTVSPTTDCYNIAYNTLFQSNIQPETDYKASIWSLNSFGASNVVILAVRTSKRFIFDTSSADISIVSTQATINFRIADSSKAIIRLNVTCCTELTTLCMNKTYIIANTDNQVIFDNLPTGNEYVFDFAVYDTDGYTYTYTMAIVKGVRVSRTDPSSYNPCKAAFSTGGKENSLLVAVIVLAALFGVAVLALIGCLIGFIARKRGHNSSQQSSAAQPPVPKRGKKDARETSEYANAGDYCRPTVNLNPSKEDAFYTALEESSDRAKQSSGGRPKQQFPKSSNETSVHQDHVYESGNTEANDDIFYTRLNGTLDRSQRNCYQ